MGKTKKKPDKKKKVKIKQIPVKKLSKKAAQKMSLRERMTHQLAGARFRYINEQLYTSGGSPKATQVFKKDPAAYQAYHEGFKLQAQQWPVNPVQVIIKRLRKRAKEGHVIADLGCGEAEIAQTLTSCRVHSVDLVSCSPLVIQADMANTPIESESVDTAVFCLSLMATNVNAFIKEAHRILKLGGLLKIAEVESRIDNITHFIKAISAYGFQLTRKDLSHQLFYFIDFKKIPIGKPSKKLPDVLLTPCLYKKR